jgi:hypothetical protein
MGADGMEAEGGGEACRLGQGGVYLIPQRVSLAEREGGGEGEELVAV